MKRLIFTLLYDEGHFVLSRNFRRQKIGDINWLFRNYKFDKVAFGLDEILLIDVSKTPTYRTGFFSVLSELSKRCFIPITAGGRVRSTNDAHDLFQHGADKVFINSVLIERPGVCRELVQMYGSQAVVAGINFGQQDGAYRVLDSPCNQALDQDVTIFISKVNELGVGEVVLQSFDRDGTGNGLDLLVTDLLPKDIEIPVVLLGGVGQSCHVIEGLGQQSIDAVSTANILNFIGNSFLDIRSKAIENGIQIPAFDLDLPLQ